MDTKEFDTIIQANRKSLSYWKDLWKYRELFVFLSWRDLLVRYKQTAIGLAWSILRPLLTMLVLSFVFGRVARLDSQGVPYPLLVFAAMIPWTLFANGFNDASNSLVKSANLITKIYFPRMIIPSSTVLVSLVDFLISALLFAGIMVYYRHVPPARIIYLPLLIILLLVATAGPSLLVASLNVKYRDFRYVVPFIIQFGLYISPVGFSSAAIHGKLQYLYALNPLVGIIEGFRWALLGTDLPFLPVSLTFSTVISLVVLLVGLAYFRKTERYFADIV